jgi:phenylacetic acid degradation operon negative regulatory protein
LTLFTTRTSGLAADRALAARCWDLDSLGADYQVFVKAVRARMPEYQQAAADGRIALVERVRLVTDYRRFARHDPQLPEELQPAGWPGDEARRLFRQAHALLAAPSATHYAELFGNS